VHKRLFAKPYPLPFAPQGFAAIIRVGEAEKCKNCHADRAPQRSAADLPTNRLLASVEAIRRRTAKFWFSAGSHAWKSRRAENWA